MPNLENTVQVAAQRGGESYLDAYELEAEDAGVGQLIWEQEVAHSNRVAPKSSPRADRQLVLIADKSTMETAWCHIGATKISSKNLLKKPNGVFDKSLLKRTKRADAEIKAQIELACANEVVRLFAPGASFLRPGNPNKREPDILYSLGDRVLGIENTVAYYGQEHAKGIHGQIREKTSVIKFAITQPDLEIQQSVQSRIQEKAGKCYLKVDEVWLVIHQQAEFSDLASTDRTLKQIDIPKEHPFTRMFLVHILPIHDGSGIRVVQFFPKLVSRSSRRKRYRNSMKLCLLIGATLAAVLAAAKGTSLDVLEEMAQQEAVDYMNAHNMSIQHGPAIISGSFKEIVLSASFIENGKEKTVLFRIDPTYDKSNHLPIKSVTIR